MVISAIRIANGPFISSGANEVNALMSVDIHESVNTGNDLTLGSVCASEAVISIINPQGNLVVNANDRVELFRDDVLKGIFYVESMRRTSPNILELTCYDCITKLDKDITEWLDAITEWPLSIETLAYRTCEHCGVQLTDVTDMLNSNFEVNKFYKAGLTARQLLMWIGEVSCCYVKAKADGTIAFQWYGKRIDSIGYTDKAYARVQTSDTDVKLEGTYIEVDPYENHNLTIISPWIETTIDQTGHVTMEVTEEEIYYYYQNGLKYEDYESGNIQLVQIRLGTGDSAYLWPYNANKVNSYIIEDNPFLNAAQQQVEDALLNVAQRLSTFSYKPCSVTIPENNNIKVGQLLRILDKNGYIFDTCVMTHTTKGHKSTLSSVGSYRRDSTSAYNGNKTIESVAQKVVNAQTQQDIFNKLTKNGTSQGIYLEHDGQLYINASYIASGILGSPDGKIQINLSNGASGPVFNTGISTNGIVVRGDEAGVQELLTILALKDSEDAWYADFEMRNTQGSTFAQIVENDARTGGGVKVYGIGSPFTAELQATQTSTGFICRQDGVIKCYLGLDSEKSALVVQIVQTDDLNVTGDGNVEWVWDSTLGRNVLCRK